jgi:bacterioferritin-associated ferredoxin
MYVCICNAVTERDVAGAVADGCRTLRDLRATLEVGSCCGRCTGHAREVLDATLGAQTTARPRTGMMSQPA